MVVCFVQNFFFGQHNGQNIYFVARSAIFFLQNLTLGYMTKTLNQIIFYFLHQNQNIFFSNIGNQNIFFQKKTITPPFKLIGPSLTKFVISIQRITVITNKLFWSPKVCYNPSNIQFNLTMTTHIIRFFFFYFYKITCCAFYNNLIA